MDTHEKTYAKNLLASRKKGPSFARLMRKNGLRYSFLLVVAAATSFAAWRDSTPWLQYGAPFVTGLALAVFFRDWGWTRVSRRSWPFHEKVINWDLVEEIASDERQVP